jgi:cAMP-dependent protein kinase regulator
MLSLSKTIATLVRNIDAEIDTDDEGLDDDDDTFDSDYHGKEDDFKSPSAPPVISKRNTTRRFSVSSESLDPAKLKDQISKISIVPKDQETMTRLYQLVSKSPMLRRLLDPEERTLIAKAFAGPLLRSAGEDIITQGDIGEVFYLLESGNVDVFVKRDGVESKVHTYHDGDAFGQLALMYNAPRAATCRSVTDVKLWTLDRTSFKVIIAGAALRKREMHLAFLNQVQILQSLTEYEKMMLADSLLEEKYGDGTAICQEGQYGNDFYIILEGRANAYQKGKDEKEKLVMSYTVGEYFGEIALLTSKPRQATVRAEGEVKVLVIDRPTFNRVFGSMEDVLKRNIELSTKYSNYT